MTLSYFFERPHRLALLALPLWVAAVHAQPVVAAPASADNAPEALSPPVAYQSALEGYRPYTDEKTINWKEANDVAGRIGGWRAYAKEAAQTGSDPHAGHGKQTEAKP